jgi:DNA-binding GntR family transcriptional regulator
VIPDLTVEHTSTAERVALALRERILAGILPPGTHLREEVLARSSGVSRNTVRESIHILVREGLVTHARHRGAVVAQLDEDDVADIYRIRRLIETAGIDASPRAPADRLEKLEAEMHALAMAGRTRSAKQLVEHDLGFHRSIVALLCSRRAERFFDSIKGELHLCFTILSAVDQQYDDPAPLVDDHQAIFDAIVGGRVAEARARLSEHLDSHESRLREILIANRAVTGDGG